MPDPFAARSRRAVEAILDDLEAAYGTFPVVDWTAVNDLEYFEHGPDLFEAGHRGGARMTNDDDHLLLIREA